MASDSSSSRTHKSCDACTNRKVRCSGAPGPCSNCVRRQTECIFGVRKLGRKPNVVRQFIANTGTESGNSSSDGPQCCTVSVLDFATPPSPKLLQPAAPESNPTPRSVASDPGRGGRHRIPVLHVDRVLERAEVALASSKGIIYNKQYVRGNGIFSGDNSLTYFSETRLKSLSQCLGHDRVRALVERISGTVNLHMRTIVNFSSNMGTRQAKTPGCLSDKARVSECTRLYFERVHPRFPFLDRAAFEATAASQGQPNVIPRSKSWTALFHTVLALGSEYAGGGSFEPGKGESWELFSVALANYTDLMLLPDSLTTLQAFTAMTIYALGMSSVGLDQIIMSEAVRRAQNLQEARFSGNATDAFRRTFWSLYCLEKITSFHHGRSSGFVDCDIACPIPYAQDSIFGGYNWFLSFIKHARLLSRAYTSLFAIGVSDNPDEYYLDIIDQLSEELEEWRVSIPDTGFRPGGVLKPHRMEGESLARTCAVSIHFFYYSFLQTVSRMALRHLPASQVAKREAVLNTVEHASRSLIELTPLIEVAPYTPMWMLAGIPVAGFFVLFDITIHNPRSPLATSNLALLDIVAGHSSQLEYMSKGIIPGSVIGEFAHIARNYVNDVGGGGGSSTGNTPPRHTPENSQYLYSQPYWSLPQAVTQSMVAMDVTADFSDMNLVAEGEQTDSIESMDIEGLPMPPSNVMGTDVMGLFGFWVPDMDPLLYQGLTGQNDPLHGTPQADNTACVEMS